MTTQTPCSTPALAAARRLAVSSPSTRPWRNGRLDFAKSLALAAPIALALGLVGQAPARASRLHMFVTSAAGSGDLSTWADSDGESGLAGGDNICQNLATAAGLANPGAYRAWLSTSTTDAYCHLHQLSGSKALACGEPSLPTSAGPWLRTDGADFSGKLPDLLHPTSQLFYPPRVDENGAVRHVFAWTATDRDGTLEPGSACNGWSSASSSNSGGRGKSDDGSDLWSLASFEDCSQPNHLYCFETIAGDDLAPRTNSDRLAFVTSSTGTGDLSSWPEAAGQSGREAGDTICRTLAQVAQLPLADTFKAWLSISFSDASSHFDHDGAWMRLDRVRVATSLADLTDGFIRSAINFSESGLYVLQEHAWTGTHFDGTGSSTFCANWTDGSAGSTGSIGTAIASDLPWTDDGPSQCSLLRRLYCFQDFDLVFWDAFESSNFGSWTSNSP